MPEPGPELVRSFAAVLEDELERLTGRRMPASAESIAQRLMLVMDQVTEHESCRGGERCAYCGTDLFGGPGGWHDEDGREICPSPGSPTTFHEPKVSSP